MLSLGLQAEFKDLFGDFECEATKLNLSEEEKLEALQAACPDDSAELLEAVCGAYSAYVLQGLLSYAEGQTISHNMIKKYDCYAEDLECLKALVRDYLPKTKGDDGLKPFDRFFVASLIMIWIRVIPRATTMRQKPKAIPPITCINFRTTNSEKKLKSC